MVSQPASHPATHPASQPASQPATCVFVTRYSFIRFVQTLGRLRTLGKLLYALVVAIAPPPHGFREGERAPKYWVRSGPLAGSWVAEVHWPVRRGQVFGIYGYCGSHVLLRYVW